MTTHDLAVLAGLIAAFTVASVAGLPEYLGAHLWWAQRSGIVGSLIGAACLVGLRRVGLHGWPLISIGAVSFALSSAAAVFGKRVFVASFGDNSFAGRFWFFGWFAVSASLFVLIAALLLHRLRR